MPKGLFNPKNYAPTSQPSQFDFKEGIVQVLESDFRVLEGKTGQAPMPGLFWGVKRLAEDQTPLRDEEGHEVIQDVAFSCGGKSLADVHPGSAASADDEEIADAGDTPGSSGPTLKILREGWFPHPKSSIAVLYGSLTALQYKEEYLDRVWAPDFVGAIFHMKTLIGQYYEHGKLVDAGKIDRTFTGRDGKVHNVSDAVKYKIVDRIIRAPYDVKGATGAKAPAGQIQDEAQDALAIILTRLSSQLDGQKLTRKALIMAVTSKDNVNGLNPKVIVPMSSLLRSDTWMAANLAQYDMVLDAAGDVVIGKLPF